MFGDKFRRRVDDENFALQNSQGLLACAEDLAPIVAIAVRQVRSTGAKA